MSLYSDLSADYQFERDYPFGLPNKYWLTRNGEKILVSEMSSVHISNCMRLVGEDDPWYAYFQEELNKRINQFKNERRKT